MQSHIKINSSYYERIASLESKFEMSRGELKKISRQLDDVRSSLDQLRGGWRGLLSMMGAASLVGALISGVSNLFK